MNEPRTTHSTEVREAPAPVMAWTAPLEIRLADVEPGPDPYLVCPNCGATMYERACKLRCRCGYFLSCSDL